MIVHTIASNMIEVETDAYRILISYKTPVAYYDRNAGYAGGVYYRTEKKWSTTTTRHINKWLGGAKSLTTSQETLDRLLD